MLRCYVGVMFFAFTPDGSDLVFLKIFERDIGKTCGNAIFPEQNRAEVFWGNYYSMIRF